MEALAATTVVAFLLFAYLGLGVWVFSSLLLVGATGLMLILGMDVDRISAILKGIMWRSAASWELSAIPIFLMMGEVMLRTDMSERLFRGLVPWVNPLPGRLLHANVLGCTLFGAICGSSTATTITVGRITMKTLEARHYDLALSIGSLAGAGALGILIPPSIALIVYGVLAEVSISRLFAAGIFPGLLIAGLFSAYIVVRSVISPDVAPKEQDHYSFGDRLRAAVQLLPVFALMTVVLGGIYIGVATPSESAVLGLLGALILAAAGGKLTWPALRDSLMSTVTTTAMLISIVVGANFLAAAMGYLHVPQEVGALIAAADLSPLGLILILLIFYLVLGLFLDGISIIVVSLPVTLPLIVAHGFDPIWYGIFLVIMVEIGLLTPPVGLNIFILQALTGRSLGEVSLAALPFFLLMCLATLIMIFLPGIVLWLPEVLFGVGG